MSLEGEGGREGGRFGRREIICCVTRGGGREGGRGKREI